MNVRHVTGPAFLASALVHGDCSSFDDEGRDQALLDSFLLWCAPGRVVGTVEGTDNEFAVICFRGEIFPGAVVDYMVIDDD